MSVLHRWDAALAPRVCGVAARDLFEGLASHALLALVVAPRARRQDGRLRIAARL